MSELINQLSEQAKSTIPVGIDVNEWIEQYNRNFTQLIVKRCLSIIEQAAEYSPELYGVALDIVELFDIEDERED